MTQQLNQYLIKYKNVIFPGLGTFHLNRKPAQFYFERMAFTAPVWEISFNEQEVIPPKDFYTKLTSITGENENVLQLKVNDYSKDVIRELTTYKKVSLPNLGLLTIDDSGRYNFYSESTKESYFPDIIAGRIVRENVNKSLFEDTTALPTTQINITTESEIAKERNKTEWWVDAIILAILAFGAIGFYYYQNNSF